MNVGGLGRSTGSFAVAWVMAACTSVAAASRLFDRSNCSTKLVCPCAAIGGHHLQSGNLHELAFERRGHIVGHRLGRGARIAHLNLNHRIVHRRQIVHRQT